MDMLEKSQDEQRQRLEDRLRTAWNAPLQQSIPPRATQSGVHRVLQSHHVYITSGVWRRLRCDCTAARRRPLSENITRPLGVVPGGGVEPPRYQVPADFESAASAS